MNQPIFLQTFIQRRLDALLAFALALTAFGVYLRTLCPTLYWGDCGELAAVVATLGVPHPTGYPLYCLLGKAWTLLLPLGSIAWRLNVLSAVFGSLAVACLYGAARVLTLPRPLALAAAGLLAFSFTFWQQCLLTETYTLAALFTCLLLFLAARWRARGCQAGDLRLLALAYGFTLTSHQTNTLFLPGFLAFVLWSAPHLRRLGERAVRREWAQAVGLGILPLLLYLYVPLRAMAHPACNWGGVETPFAFYYYVTGRGYAHLMFHRQTADIVQQLSLYTENVRNEFSWPIASVAALGLSLLWKGRTERPFALLLTWIFLADIAFVVNYGIYNRYIYYIPSYIVLSLCAGRGLLGLWQMLEPRLSVEKRPIFTAFAAFCALALVPVQAVSHRVVDLSRNRTCENYGRNLLASVPLHGILIENGDDTAGAAILYLQIVEEVRPDVTLVRRGLLDGIYDPDYKRWVNRWYLDGVERSYPAARTLYPGGRITPMQALTEDPMRRLIRDAEARQVPVCVLAPAGEPVWFSMTRPTMDDDGKEMPLNEYLNRHYDTATIGLITQVFPRGRLPSPPALRAETERVWKSYALDGVFDGQLQDDKFLVLLALTYSNAGLVRAQVADTQGDYATAETAYAQVLSLFTCDAATQGLERCQRKRRQAALPLSRKELSQ